MSTAWGQSQPFRAANLNHIRFANQFPGANVTARLDAALADIGSGSGVLVATPTLGFGAPTTWRNNVAFLDFRQTYDPIDTGTDDPDRVALMLLENRLGDMTTRPVTGTVTLTNGSTAVTGVGTQFLAQLANHFGRSIKLDADSSTSWAHIASVTDDTHATLSEPYPGTGGTGPASYFRTELGLVINNKALAGTPNTGSGGESVGLTVVSNRSGGTRGLWGANLNLTYSTRDIKASAVGLEIDMTNESSGDGVADVTVEQALRILSAGSRRIGEGIYFGSFVPGGGFERAISINDAYSSRGIHIKGASNHIYLIPTADNNSPMLVGKNSVDVLTKWRINNDGSASFDKAGLGTSSPSARIHGYESNNSLKIVGKFENDQNGTGTAAIGLGVASSALGETSAFKGGLGLTRALSKGRGDLCLYNRLADDALDFTAGDAILCGSSAGALNLLAQGTNQSITATPTGSGGFVVPGASGDAKNLTWFGPGAASFGTTIQDFATSAGNFQGMLNSTRIYGALVANEDNNGTNNTIGLGGVGAATHTSGTRGFVVGLEGDAYHQAAGTTTVVAGVLGYAEMAGTSGTVTSMASVYAGANTRSAGTVSLNYGLFVDDQTAGTNNYSVYTVGTAPARFGGPVISALNVVTFSATPTFDARLGNTQKITLTGNVTSSTLANAAMGEQINFLICQDATGNRTFVWPTNVKGGMTIGSTASKCSAQNFIFDGTNAYALSSGVTNL